jgi:hypothetical protein
VRGETAAKEGAAPRRLGPGRQVPLGPAVDRALSSRTLIYLLVAVGGALRLAQYAFNRSLWVDEAWLGLNLIERPLSGLTKPLSFNQAAPVGFLLTEGVVGKALGYGEYALRLLPILSGIASIPVFAWLSRRMLPRFTAPCAVLLFAVAGSLIYYSSEIKPYGIDVTAAVCLLAAGMLLLDENQPGRRAAGALAIGGLVLLPFSFASFFMVASIAIAFGARLAIKREWQSLRSPASFTMAAWVAAVLGLVAFARGQVQHVRQSFGGSTTSFLGVGGSSSPQHAANVFGTNAAHAIGFLQQRPYSQIEKLAFACALVGAVAVFRRNVGHGLMLVAPIALVYVAAAAHLYPILLRTELFLVPGIILLIAAGVAQLVRWVPTTWRVAVALILTVALCAGPTWQAGKAVVHPRTREEIKPVLEFIRARWRPGDTLYVYHGAQYAFFYYEECHCLRLSLPGRSGTIWPVRLLPGGADENSPAGVSLSRDLVIGRYFGQHGSQYIADLNRVRGRRRVWFLYTHFNTLWEQSFIQGPLLHHMGLLGVRTAGIDRQGAHAYLYEMRTGK